MSRLLASRENEGKAKVLRTVNCSEFKGLSKFVNEFLIPKVVDQEVTVFFDECHMMPKQIANALLTILNPNKDRRTQYSYEDFDMDFDFTPSLSWWRPPNTTRYSNLWSLGSLRLLQEYSLEELGKIVSYNLDGYDFEDGVLEDIASVTRGNVARQPLWPTTSKITWICLAQPSWPVTSGITSSTPTTWIRSACSNARLVYSTFSTRIIRLRRVSFVCANVGDTLGTVQNYEKMLMKTASWNVRITASGWLPLKVACISII